MDLTMSLTPLVSGDLADYSRASRTDSAKGLGLPCMKRTEQERLTQCRRRLYGSWWLLGKRHWT